MASRTVDFRSDTVTQPTEAMRRAMAAAEVGDDVLGEDPTVRRLEAKSAALFGKEAALFVVSGTMANQIAMMALTDRGDEILVGEDAHIYNLEVGGLAALSGVQARPLSADRGRFAVSAVTRAIRPNGLQSATTRVLCLENTYDLNRGIPLPASDLAEMADLAHHHGLAVYLDGARIFNAALAVATPLNELCRSVDCLQFCLSKGLSAPIGSLLVGEAAFIARARRLRQRIGGGMRQGGHMAAAGIVALDEMMPRLKDDHANAARLAEGLAAIDARLIERDVPRTNIVRLDFAAAGKTAAPIVSALAGHGVKIKQVDETTGRMITHYGIEADDIAFALDAFRQVWRG